MCRQIRLWRSRLRASGTSIWVSSALRHHVGNTDIMNILCRSVAPSYVASTNQHWDSHAFGSRWRGANWSVRSSGVQHAWWFSPNHTASHLLHALSARAPLAIVPQFLGVRTKRPNSRTRRETLASGVLTQREDRKGRQDRPDFRMGLLGPPDHLSDAL